MTHTPGPESQVTWAPDSTRVAYLSERDAITHVFVYDFAKHAEKQLTYGPLPDQGPRFSPDGKTIAFVRDRKELRVVDMEGEKITDRELASGFIGGGFGATSYTWSPDSKWIAYSNAGSGGLRNVYVVPAAGALRTRLVFWPTRMSIRSSGARMEHSCCMRPASGRRFRKWHASI